MGIERKLRIVATADLHAESDRNGVDAYEVAKEISKLNADVLLLDGDIIDDKQDLERVLGEFSKFKGDKLYVLGNHEMALLSRSKVPYHLTEFKELLAEYGFHLLDGEPFLHEESKIGIVGNIGWYDGTFFHKLKNQMNLQEGDPQTYNQVLTRAMSLIWENPIYRERFSQNFNTLEFFETCLKDIRENLTAFQNSENVDYIVLATHHMPRGNFHTRKKIKEYRFAAAFNGSDRIGDLYGQFSKIKLGMYGHFHNPKNRLRYIDGVPVYNITSKSKKPYHIFDIMSDGSIKNKRIK